jgi:hypothetical protein
LLRLLADNDREDTDPEPSTEPPLPYTCEGCGQAVLLHVLHVGEKHVLRWTPADKVGQDWYPDE